MSFDTETTGLDTMTARLVGLSFCWLPGEAYYVPVPTDDQAAAQAIVDEFCPFFEAENHPQNRPEHQVRPHHPASTTTWR